MRTWVAWGCAAWGRGCPMEPLLGPRSAAGLYDCAGA